MSVAAAGVGLTALLAGVGWMVWGKPAVPAVLAFGLLATGIQVVATALMRRGPEAPFPVLARRWGAGMGMRLGGVVVLAAAVAVDPEHFPPLASALGYLGVVLPLLMLEMRLVR